MLTRIRGGRVIDPGHLDAVADIFVQEGHIIAIVEHDGEAWSSTFHNQPADCLVVDATGKIVTPGLIDMHVHLREPGYEHKETIQSGCRAAAWGGFTAVCAMPNTNPVNDSIEVTRFVFERAAQAQLARVYPVAAVTRGSEGRTLCDFEQLKQAGAVALSDDGRPVMNSRVMRRALETAKKAGLPVIVHCEDLELAAGGSMNAGRAAEQLGVGGIPNVSESVMVMRDIALSELTGAALHIAHVSTAESVRAIRQAKERGLPVTAETAPHYFTLTDEAVLTHRANAKMNPPLRSARDREAVREALADGTIDAIATDHAPHGAAEKDVALEKAANGIIGLETSVPLGLQLVRDGLLSMVDWVSKMSNNPARILGLTSGLRVGRPADLTIIDPDVRHLVRATAFQSLSRNTPFDGRWMTGKAVLTMVEGRIIHSAL